MITQQINTKNTALLSGNEKSKVCTKKQTEQQNY